MVWRIKSFLPVLSTTLIRFSHILCSLQNRFPPTDPLLPLDVVGNLFFLVRRFTKNISTKAERRVGWKESNVVLRVGGGDGKLSCAFLASSWLLYRVLSTVWCIVIWIFFSFTRLSVVGLVFGCEWDSFASALCCCMVYLRESNAIRMRSEEKSHQNVDFVCLKCSFGCSFFVLLLLNLAHTINVLSSDLHRMVVDVSRRNEWIAPSSATCAQ